MRRSDRRILTTRTGSLPRPAELTRLYARRARGESVDPAELDRLGQAAQAIGDRKRVIAGTDCGSDTSAGMGRVAEDVVWATLKLGDGARLASNRLHPG